MNHPNDSIKGELKQGECEECHKTVWLKRIRISGIWRWLCTKCWRKS